MGADHSVRQYNHVVLFDGVCVFCNRSVDFILDHEKDETLTFAPLQSETGQEILKEFNYPADYLDSILFLENGKLLNKSGAALSIAKYLNLRWSWLAGFRFVPAFIRDAVYWVIARYRYKIFGKHDACRVPTPELRKRFLE